MKKIRMAGALALSLVIVAPHAAAHRSNVFGKDDREQITSTEYPWSTIGYLSTGCSGTLIAKNLVLTAGHCVYKKGTLSASSFTFYPNMIEANTKHSSVVEYIWAGSSHPDDDNTKDWAVLRLADNLGDIYGTMGLDSGGVMAGDVVTQAGYSGDVADGMTATTHRNCNIRDVWGNLALNDCDYTRGASGGPFFIMKNDLPYIVALVVAEYRGGGDKSLELAKYSVDDANIGVTMSLLYDEIADIIANPYPPAEPAARECTVYSPQALALVQDGDYQDWEIRWARQICTSYALEAFKIIRDKDYFEWEMQWASGVNNEFALAAFREVADDDYQEWEIQWATEVNSQRELDAVRALRKRGSYYESDLREVASLD